MSSKNDEIFPFPAFLTFLPTKTFFLNNKQTKQRIQTNKENKLFSYGILLKTKPSKMKIEGLTIPFNEQLSKFKPVIAFKAAGLKNPLLM